MANLLNSHTAIPRIISTPRPSSKATYPISTDDRHHFFASLANVVTSIKQDEQGMLPDGLKTGPNIEVRSFNKKQRPTVTQFKTRPRLESLAPIASSTITPQIPIAPALSLDQREYHITERPGLPVPGVLQMEGAQGIQGTEPTTEATHPIHDAPEVPSPRHHHTGTEKQSSPSLELIEHPVAAIINTRKDTITVLESPQNPTIGFETVDVLANHHQGHIQANSTSATILNTSTSNMTRKTKRDKEPPTTVAALVGPRKRRAVVLGTHITISETKDKKKVVIDLDSEGDDDSPIEANRTTRTGLTTSIFSSASPSSSSKVSKPLETKVVATTRGSSGPLAGVRVYVIPTNMNKDIFDVSRKRVLELHGEWVGPKSKVLTPHAKDLPPLDPRTTHIVTSLSNLEAVKKALKADVDVSVYTILIAYYSEMDILLKRKKKKKSNDSVFFPPVSNSQRSRLSKTSGSQTRFR